MSRRPALALHVAMGVPASGKSTWADRFGETAAVICPDRIREGLTGRRGDLSQDEHVWQIAYAAARLGLRQGKTVVFDATGVRKAHRERLLAIAREFAAVPVLHVFRPPFALCVERNRARTEPVPDDVMTRMYTHFCQALSEIGWEAWSAIHVHTEETP